MIRGDLPIVPNNTGWFQVPATPQTMLNAGAIAVMSELIMRLAITSWHASECLRWRSAAECWNKLCYKQEFCHRSRWTRCKDYGVSLKN